MYHEDERRLERKLIMESSKRLKYCEKCGVSYEDAKAALDACDDNVLDAIIWLEKQGKSTAVSKPYYWSLLHSQIASPEMEAAQIAY